MLFRSGYNASILARATASSADIILMAGSNVATLDTTAFKFSMNLIPTLTNNKDLGTSDLRWKDMWLAGNVTASGVFVSPSGQSAQGFALSGGGGPGTNGAAAGHYPVSAYESYGWNFTVQAASGQGRFRVVRSNRSYSLFTIWESGYAEFLYNNVSALGLSTGWGAGSEIGRAHV